MSQTGSPMLVVHTYSCREVAAKLAMIGAGTQSRHVSPDYTTAYSALDTQYSVPRFFRHRRCVKVKVRTVDMVASTRESSPEKRSGITHPTRSSAIGMSRTCSFAFPAPAGTHLPTPEGWKAELAWVAGYVTVYLPENHVRIA